MLYRSDPGMSVSSGRPFCKMTSAYLQVSLTWTSYNMVAWWAPRPMMISCTRLCSLCQVVPVHISLEKDRWLRHQHSPTLSKSAIDSIRIIPAVQAYATYSAYRQTSSLDGDTSWTTRRSRLLARTNRHKSRLRSSRRNTASRHSTVTGTVLQRVINFAIA